jgi:hypothetical protein
LALALLLLIALISPATHCENGWRPNVNNLHILNIVDTKIKLNSKSTLFLEEDVPGGLLLPDTVVI